MFKPLMIAISAVVGVVLGAIGLAVLTRFTSRPVSTFRTLVALITLLSLGAPLQALMGAMPGFPAVTTATGLSMIVMHVLTGGLIAGLLPALARR